MKLIADSGSTKTDWVLIHDSSEAGRYSTPGYNPFFFDAEAIYNSLSENLLEKLQASEINEIYFYGAGCSSPEKCNIVQQALRQAFPDASIIVSHDLLASAKALLGDSAGFAAILGTGANTCLYDGEKVIFNVDSLGYILGDEGSGCHIGRKLLRDYMRKLMPQDLWEDFRETYKLDNEHIYDILFNKPSPNRFLASFAKFAQQHKHSEYIRAKVRDSFHDFFKNLVSHYPNYTDHTLNCVGSIGYIFKDILIDKAEEFNMKPGKIIQSPIHDLVLYHLK
ncbi:MAG: N-acetylglucosamine kinase [Bacteroidota bacterium]|nr:N-acetylglucosamine kinase [Bacteroidota bacterium]